MFSLKNIVLLRIHFSFFLLPVFLSAVLGSAQRPGMSLLWMFIILHLIIYPSSNAYNSLNDRDTGPVGGLETPPLPEKGLGLLTMFLDFLGLSLSLLVGRYFFIGVLCYIAFSRLYSYRKVRLKQFPFIAFFCIIGVQGFLTAFSIGLTLSGKTEIFPLIFSTLFLASAYPVSQLYQHETDYSDKVVTISMLLGKKGSLIASGIVFLILGILSMYFFTRSMSLAMAGLYLVCQIPVGVYFIRLLNDILKKDDVNYKAVYRLMFVSTLSNNLILLIYILIRNL